MTTATLEKTPLMELLERSEELMRDTSLPSVRAWRERTGAAVPTVENPAYDPEAAGSGR